MTEFIPWGDCSYEDFEKGARETAQHYKSELGTDGLLFATWMESKKDLQRNWDWEIYTGRTFSGRCECCGSALYNKAPIDQIIGRIESMNDYWDSYVIVNGDGAILQKKMKKTG